MLLTLAVFYLLANNMHDEVLEQGMNTILLRIHVSEKNATNTKCYSKFCRGNNG
jgi:hypothetical protein